MTNVYRANKKISILVPFSADQNPGDQALVWEAAALIREADLADEVWMVESEEQAARNASPPEVEGLELRWIPSLLRHPRRGRHHPQDAVKERWVSLIQLALRSLSDFIWGSAILLLSPWPALVDVLLDERQRETLALFRRATLVVVKGGGFIHGFGGPTAFYYTWFILFYLALAHKLHKPVIVLPNSYGPFLGWGVRRLVRRIISRCQFVCARESVSAQMLGELIHQPVPVFPDMGYYLKPAPQKTAEDICRRFGVPLQTKPCVGFTLRPYRFPNSPDPLASFDRYLEAIAGFVRHLVGHGFHPVLITHTRGPSAHENDRLALQQLCHRLGQLEHSWIDFEGSCREMKAIYGCMNYVVGTRFHSVIFAQCALVPCLAISYGGNKAVGIMSDLGLAEYVVPIEQVTADLLCAKFDQLMEQADQVRNRLSQWHENLGTARKTMSEQIGSALKDSLKEAAGKER